MRAKALCEQSLAIYMQLTEEQIKLVNILENFFRKPDHAESPLLYSTADIYYRLQSVYPSPSYTPEDVYVVLIYLKFETIDSTSRKIVWLIQDKEL